MRIYLILKCFHVGFLGNLRCIEKSLVIPFFETFQRYFFHLDSPRREAASIMMIW